MKNLDINNPDHKVKIQDALRGGGGEFWEIISQKLKMTIEATEERILNNEEIINLPANEYKSLMELLRRQRQDRLDILDMPEDLVKELDSPDFFKREEEEEVYATKEDFEK